MIAKRLVTLYTSGSTSTLEVILGAQNLEQVLNRIDTANRVSVARRQVASQVAHFKAAVIARRPQLASRAGAGRAARRRAGVAAHAIEARLGERQQRCSRRSTARSSG